MASDAQFASPARQLLQLVLICSAIALLLSLIVPGITHGAYAVNFIFSFAFGLAIWGSEGLMARYLPALPRRYRIPLSLPIGVFIGYHAASFIIEELLGITLSIIPDLGIQAPAMGFFFGAAVSYIFYAQYRYMETRAKLEQSRAEQAEQRQAVGQSQLRALQAQIEPHFLFNTLANIHSRIEAEPDTAREMLERLTQLLRHNLRRSRGDETTLGQELELLESYLAIQALRMGGRLRYTIDSPAELAATPLPPLLLQPLVENAVLHGIEPRVEGGSVSVCIEKGEGKIIASVIDSGVGLQSETAGTGLGLQNIRERLDGLYGDHARLLLQQNEQGGISAVMELPHG